LAWEEVTLFVNRKSGFVNLLKVVMRFGEGFCYFLFLLAFHSLLPPLFQSLIGTIDRLCPPSLSSCVKSASLFLRPLRYTMVHPGPPSFLVCVGFLLFFFFISRVEGALPPKPFLVLFQKDPPCSSQTNRTLFFFSCLPFSPLWPHFVFPSFS